MGRSRAIVRLRSHRDRAALGAGRMFSKAWRNSSTRCASPSTSLAERLLNLDEDRRDHGLARLALIAKLKTPLPSPIPLNPTLFSEIQRLFERTYAAVGINLEDCLIDRQRCGQLSRLAGASARELSELARTFLRTADGQLHVGDLLFPLARSSSWSGTIPRAGLNDANISSLMAAFVEEINHALHAALQLPARGTSGNRQRGFRAQPGIAGASRYLSRAACSSLPFSAKRRKTSLHGPALAAFPPFCPPGRPNAYRDPNLRGRYLETNEAGKIGTHTISTRLSVLRRLDEIRAFHALDYEGEETAYSGAARARAAHRYAEGGTLAQRQRRTEGHGEIRPLR